jgi:hypothetical protein
VEKTLTHQKNTNREKKRRGEENREQRDHKKKKTKKKTKKTKKTKKNERAKRTKTVGDEESKAENSNCTETNQGRKCVEQLGSQWKLTKKRGEVQPLEGEGE